MTLHNEDLSHEPGGRYAWFLMAFLPVAWYGSSFAAFSLGLMLPDMKGDIGLSDTQGGVLGGAIFGASVLLTLPLTPWLARFRPAPLMTYSLLAATACVIAMALAPDFWTQLAARASLASVWVAGIPIRTKLTRQWMRPDQFAVVNGLHQAEYGALEVFTFAATPWLIGIMGGWRGALALGAVLCAVAALCTFLFARERPLPAQTVAVANPHGSSLDVLRRHRELWAVALIAFGCDIGWGAFITFYPTFGLEEFGLSEGFSGVALAVSSLAMVPGGLLAISIARRVGPRMVFMVPSLMLGLSFVGLALIGQPVVVITLWVVIGTAWVYFPVLMTIPFHLKGARDDEVAVASSFLIAVVNASIAIGPPITGALGDAAGSLQIGLLVTSASPLITIAGVMLTPRDTLRTAPSTPVRGLAAAATV